MRVNICANLWNCYKCIFWRPIGNDRNGEKNYNTIIENKVDPKLRRTRLMKKEWKKTSVFYVGNFVAGPG